VDDFEAMRKELALNLIQMKENLEPLYEAAEGTRADLIKRGWSPPVAERIAAEWLIKFIQAMG
jgi:hypothetical protein